LKIWWNSSIIFDQVENPEDAGPGKEIKKDEDVERVRRAHLNDLENIPAFLIAALFYICSEPDPTVALWLIRVAVTARILHTIVSFNIS
jgi:glutathione S-transferase